MRFSITSIRKNFLKFLHHLSPEDVARSPKVDFSRNRKCTLFDTVFTILMMACHSLNTEIGNYFFSNRRMPPSKSAFVQQRNKLTDDALSFIFDSLNKLFPFKKKYKGLHLLAADGSDVNAPSLPGDSDSFIPYASNNGGFYQFHLNALLDLLEDRYVDAVIYPKRLNNECRALAAMVDRNILKEPCLYIADRGFLSYNTIAHIQKASQFFLIRARAPEDPASSLRHIDFPNEDEFDIPHTFILSRKKPGKGSDLGVYKRICKKTYFDLIDEDDTSSVLEINFRIIRILLPDGKYEYLVTNLPEKRFRMNDIKYLYHLRWNIETSFRFLKYNLALNFFHSRKRSFIRQEIYARMIMYNFVSLIKGTVKIITGDTKYEYAVSTSDAVVLCRRLLLCQISISNIKELLLRYRRPIRPGRSSPRKVRSQRLRTLNNRT